MATNDNITHPAGRYDGPLPGLLAERPDLRAHLADPARHLRLVANPPATPVFVDWESEGWFAEDR